MKFVLTLKGFGLPDSDKLYCVDKPYSAAATRLCEEGSGWG